jgi:hypothetical protein
MPPAVAQRPEPLGGPGGLIAVQAHDPIRQPCRVTGQRLAVQRRQADRVEELSADAAGLEVDQRGGADVEGEALRRK